MLDGKVAVVTGAARGLGRVELAAGQPRDATAAALARVTHRPRRDGKADAARPALKPLLEERCRAAASAERRWP